MNEQIKALLQKIPAVPILLLYGAYLGYDYYTYTTDPQSPLIQKQQQVASIQGETAKVREKLKDAEKFFRSLEERKANLRKLALQLEEAKATLSEQMEVSSFLRMVNTEATKVGMTVIGLKPKDTHEEEYYVQQSFDLEFHGAFVQLVVFLERIANLERIIRVSDIKLKPMSGANDAYVLLDGGLRLNTYRYRGSKADDLGKESGSTPAPTPQKGGT